MTYEFVLEQPMKKTFAVKRMVKVPVQVPVKKRRKAKKHVHFSAIKGLPKPLGPNLPIIEGHTYSQDASELVEIEVDEEYDTLEPGFKEQEETAFQELDASVVRMTDAHNDKAHHRMFTHFFVGRRVDDRFEPPARQDGVSATDGLVFGTTEYTRRGYQEMIELDEKKILTDVVGYFGWKGKLLEVAEPDEFQDSGETA